VGTNNPVAGRAPRLEVLEGVGRVRCEGCAGGRCGSWWAGLCRIRSGVGAMKGPTGTPRFGAHHGSIGAAVMAAGPSTHEMPFGLAGPALLCPVRQRTGAPRNTRFALEDCGKSDRQGCWRGLATPDEGFIVIAKDGALAPPAEGGVGGGGGGGRWRPTIPLSVVRSYVKSQGGPVPRRPPAGPIIPAMGGTRTAERPCLAHHRQESPHYSWTCASPGRNGWPTRGPGWPVER